MGSPLDSFFSPFRQSVDHFWNMPITNWNHFFNPQFVLNYKDVDVENHVLSQVGSYGSQLSTLIGMIDLLRKDLPTDLNAQQKLAVKEFDRLREDSQRAVADYRGDPDPALTDGDHMVALLEKFKSENKDEFEAVKKQIAQLIE